VSHTQKWKVACPKLHRVQETARAKKQGQFISLATYGLSMNEAKTWLIRLGRHWPGDGKKSETFDFLGLTHIAGKSGLFMNNPD